MTAVSGPAVTISGTTLTTGTRSAFWLMVRISLNTDVLPVIQEHALAQIRIVLAHRAHRIRNDLRQLFARLGGVLHRAHDDLDAMLARIGGDRLGLGLDRADVLAVDQDREVLQIGLQVHDIGHLHFDRHVERGDRRNWSCCRSRNPSSDRVGPGPSSRPTRPEWRRRGNCS